MNNSEYFDELYRKLVDVLKHEGLDWVVQEIASRSLTGKITILTAEEVKDLPRGKKQRTYSTDYTSREKLKLLIDALEYAITDNIEMEKEVLHFFSSQENAQSTHTATEVQFYPEGIEENFTVIDPQNVANRQRYAHKLKETIDKLRELVDGNN